MTPLRIAFFYPSSAMRTPLDVSSLWSSSRGLTGSELACVMYAISMARLGHSVTLFTNVPRAGDLEKVTVCPYGEWASTYCSQNSWDALCSWMVPDPLKLVSPSKFRLYNQQVSDFLHCEQGWESYVDLLAPLSHSHAQYMRPQTSLSHDKWRVMYNGVDPEQFAPGKKESGKIVWASSHDRGLHWLLEAWPHIRAGAPHANLHIFYDFSGVQAFATIEGQSNTVRDKQLNELGQRSRYILECLRRFTPEQHGVHVHRSVSRNRMQQEMASAEVLAYPLDPVHYTETFGVTVLEACAAGVIPVLCTNDCFGELWGSVAETVPPPYSQHKGEFVAKVVGILNDADTRIAKSSQCVMYARRFAWDLLAKDLEATLTTRGMEGLPHPNWS